MNILNTRTLLTSSAILLSLWTSAYAITPVHPKTSHAAQAAGPPPLMAAIVNGNTALVRTLIAKGANVHTRFQGETPLMLAVVGGNTDILKMLIKAGSDIDAKDPSGETALSVAKTSQIADLLKAAGETK